ncbi:MAG TPA: DMT family transporter [Pseudonocardia sp.]|nr:DMT family transporter [Pseudonocardia sp.]
MDRRGTDAALAVALVMLWSSGFVGARLGTEATTATTLLAWRFLCAAAVLGVVAAVRRPRMPRGDVRRHAVLGLLIQVAYLEGVVTGIELGVPTGTAALIAATQPLLVAVAGPDRTSVRQRCGLAVGLAGVGLVVAGDLGPGTAPVWAFLLPAAGTVALAAGTLLERRWRTGSAPIDGFVVQTGAAAAAVLALAATTGQLSPPGDPTFWWAVAWTVVLSSFGGYGTYLLMLRRTGAMRTSTLLYLTPPVTALWVWAMFGQAPAPLALPGAIAAAVGAALVLGPPRVSRSASRTRRDPCPSSPGLPPTGARP